MPQITLRFKIHQDGKVEESVQGFNGNECIKATKSIEDSLGEVKLTNKTAEAFISNKSQELTQFNKESNVTF